MEQTTYKNVGWACFVLATISLAIFTISNIGIAIIYAELNSTATYVSEQQKSIYDKINIKGYNLNALLDESNTVEDVENILYPSGMQLPTKYLGLLQIAPREIPNAKSNDATKFLISNFPNVDNTYTFAEYNAAVAFVNLSRIKSVNSTCEYKVSESINYTGNSIQTATLKTCSQFLEDLNRYSDIIHVYSNMYDNIANHEDFYNITLNSSDGVILSMIDCMPFADLKSKLDTENGSNYQNSTEWGYLDNLELLRSRWDISLIEENVKCDYNYSKSVYSLTGNSKNPIYYDQSSKTAELNNINDNLRNNKLVAFISVVFSVVLYLIGYVFLSHYTPNKNITKIMF